MNDEAPIDEGVVGLSSVRSRVSKKKDDSLASDDLMRSQEIPEEENDS